MINKRGKNLIKHFHMLFTNSSCFLELQFDNKSRCLHGSLSRVWLTVALVFSKVPITSAIMVSNKFRDLRCCKSTFFRIRDFESFDFSGNHVLQRLRFASVYGIINAVLLIKLNYLTVVNWYLLLLKMTMSKFVSRELSVMVYWWSTELQHYILKR